MKNNRITKQWEWLGETYMATVFIDSGVIEIAKWEERKFFKSRYKTIYFGNIEPLSEFVKFFTESQKV